jgi:tellurite resistance protein TerC
MFDWWMWVLFFAVIGAMFAFDMGAFNKGSKHITTKHALTMTALWVVLALVFGAIIFFMSEPGQGADNFTSYVTAYVIEEMMSIDNLFVFIVIFAFFMVPDEYQHKALFYGIIGALAFRAVFIFAGTELLHRYEWVIYIFGVILIYTAFKTVFGKEETGENKTAARVSRWFKVSPTFDGDKLFTVQNGLKLMTPLLLCIIVIELTDVMFAFDSIPAVFSITTDKFIIYTSNIFAVLGLRSLFFAIKGSMEHLEYLKYGLGVILAFIGIKMLMPLIVNDFSIPIIYSLGFILGVLAVTVAVSLYKRKQKLRSHGTA